VQAGEAGELMEVRGLCFGGGLGKVETGFKGFLDIGLSLKTAIWRRGEAK
jgi:hypothetical protein